MIDLSSGFGDIIVRDSTTIDIKAKSRNGQLTLTGVQASGDATLESDFGALTFENSRAATLLANTRNGPIDVSGALGAGPHVIQTDFGSIHLALPGDSALIFELQTGFSRIRSALPVLISETLDNTHWRGTINGGGASLNAHTRNGDIVLDTQE